MERRRRRRRRRRKYNNIIVSVLHVGQLCIHLKYVSGLDKLCSYTDVDSVS